jgi:hypothetical protein
MTEASAASNGGKTSTTGDRQHGLTVLRDLEAKALISLAVDGAVQTENMLHDLHKLIYHDQGAGDSDSRDRGRMLDEALKCLGTTEHYLLMLGSVFEEQAKTNNRPDPPDPWSVEPVF